MAVAAEEETPGTGGCPAAVCRRDPGRATPLPGVLCGAEPQRCTPGSAQELTAALSAQHPGGRSGVARCHGDGRSAASSSPAEPDGVAGGAVPAGAAHRLAASALAGL